MSTSKIVTGAVIVTGAIAGGSYLYNIRRASVQLEVIPKAYIHTLNWDGLTIRVDALLKNPTRARFKVKFPYIRLRYKDAIIGTSQVVNKDIQIPSYGQVVIDSMMVNIPVLSIASGIYQIVKSLYAKEPITFKAEVITTIDLGWSQVPYTSDADITLKR
jgi:hypothetical protein